MLARVVRVSAPAAAAVASAAVLRGGSAAAAVPARACVAGARAAVAVSAAALCVRGLHTAQASSAFGLRRGGSAPASVAPSDGFFTRWAKGFAEDKQEEVFREHLEWLAGLPRFTFKEYTEQMERMKAKANSMLARVLGGNDTSIVDEADRQLRVLRCFTPEELEGKAEVDRVAKRRIAAACGADVFAVNDIVRRKEMSEKMHDFLKERKADGKPLPTKQEDLVMLFRQKTVPREWSRQMAASRRLRGD